MFEKEYKMLTETVGSPFCDNKKGCFIHEVSFNFTDPNKVFYNKEFLQKMNDFCESLEAHMTYNQISSTYVAVSISLNENSKYYIK